jgi:hypothetical protein
MPKFLQKHEETRFILNSRLLWWLTETAFTQCSPYELENSASVSFCISLHGEAAEGGGDLGDEFRPRCVVKTIAQRGLQMKWRYQELRCWITEFFAHVMPHLPEHKKSPLPHILPILLLWWTAHLCTSSLNPEQVGLGREMCLGEQICIEL